MKPQPSYHAGAPALRKPTVGIICDLAEERWPSMDLVADMLVLNLKEKFADEATVLRLRPSFARRATILPGFGRSRFARNADRLLNRFLYYPRYLASRAGQLDIFHIVDHSYAHLVHGLPAQRVIVTCHDLDAIRCIVDPASARRSLVLRAMARRILSGLQTAALVACVSAATRDELLAYGVVPAERTVIVPNGLDPVFSPIPRQPAESRADALLGEQCRGRICILHVGSTIARKRIDTLLQAFAAARKSCPEMLLLRVGGAFDRDQRELLSRLKLGGSVIELPFLDRPTLAAVYRRAAMLVLPSQAEGFGLPVIEALACGTPVIASDLPALHEAGGEAAVYCPVGDPARWADAILTVLAEPVSRPRAAEERRRRGIKHAAGFSWSANAATMVEHYRRIAFGARGYEAPGCTSPGSISSRPSGG